MNINLKVIFLIIVLGIITFVTDTSYSKDNNNIDVVLVMDSSGSMKKTDPLSLRIPAAKLFISLLDKNDRASVISFSDKSYPISYLTTVDGEENKHRLLKATDKITSDGLYTNLYDALSKGLEVLSMDKKKKRAPIIILMSDGMMDVGDPDEDKKLIDKINNEIAVMLENNGVKVFAIAFTEQSDKKLLKKISKRTGGFYNLALTDKDFHIIFTSIFESLKSPDMIPVTKNEFLIDKSIEEVTIVATKGSPDTKIRLNNPDGQSYSYKNKDSNIEWFASNNFDMITVKKPAEGKWEILFSTGENNKAYIITNLKLQTNFNQLYSIFGKPMDIEIWLEKDGTPIKEQDVLDKIDIYIELTGPEGNTTRLEPFNKEKGIFLRRIAPFNAGNYRLKIIARGKTFERQKTFVFNVAGAKESKEELDAKRSEKKAGHSVEQKSIEDTKTDTLSWSKIVIQFIFINLILGTIILIYLKRKSFKEINGFKTLINLSFIKSLIKKKEQGKENMEIEEEHEKGPKKQEELKVKEEGIDSA